MTTTDELLRRITARPDLFGGKPTIRDLRVSVESVLAFLSQGVAPEEIVDDHPGLELDDILACAAYARLAVVRVWVAAAAGEGGEPRSGPSRVDAAPAARPTLRELAARPLQERHHAIAVAAITVDARETAALDATAGDGLAE